MAWSYNGIRVFVQKNTGNKKQIIARLQPLDAGTILQTFGWEERVVKLSGLVVGPTDMNALLALTETGTAYTLSGASGNYGDYYLSNLSYDQLNSICQTVRPDLDTDAFIYQVDLELYPDV
jgi:phage protein U